MNFGEHPAVEPTWTEIAIAEIREERERQISVEGWSRDHDDNEHADGALARAAGCYALAAGGETTNQLYPRWPWNGGMKIKSPLDDLRRAGALIIAEMERIYRAQNKE